MASLVLIRLPRLGEREHGANDSASCVVWSYARAYWEACLKKEGKTVVDPVQGKWSTFEPNIRMTYFDKSRPLPATKKLPTNFI